MKNTNIPLPRWAEVIAAYVPRDGREEAERNTMLALTAAHGDCLLTRDCAFAHMTSSSVIVSPDRKRTLMAFHRIYKSWSWTGGHNDGETDFEAVARREAQEETGIIGLRRIAEGPASLEILPVWAHVKHGRPVGSHLHLNVSYLFEADDRLPLRMAQEENSAVEWIEIDRLDQMVREEEMLPIYRKLLARANDC